jgi:hypothetical protein
MNRQTTWGVIGALAAAGVLGVSLQPGARSGGNNGNGGARVGVRRAHAKASDINAGEKKRACNDLAQVLEAFLTINSAPRPESCLEEITSPPVPIKQPPPPAVDPKFVIATLPDPIHTHLALTFDRMAEVIQQAAQDEGYSYEASWLPWDDRDETYTRLVDDDQSDYRKELVEDQPGVLVFRYNQANLPSLKDTLLPYRDGLIVFVVGEDPTKGIHTQQFTNALGWIEKLKGLNSQSQARTVVLGPSFSGSFPSLAKLLASGKSGDDPGDSGTYIRQIRGSAKVPLAIYTGSANSGNAIREFGALSSGPSLADLNIDFHSFLEHDEVGLERYFQYLEKQSHERNAIAVISEDETAYGGSGAAEGREGTDTSQAKCSQDPLWLYYPRDISALRTAYQANSLFNTTAPQQSSDVPRSRLPTDLADPEGQDHDTIRSYAGNQAPLSQESYLLGIVNAMRVCHSENVVLRSSNPLDQLFLAHYLRRAYPDARIVTDGSDRLFERDRGAIGMGETMSISTYPLLEREREWIGSSTLSPGQRLFNSDTSEGTYIAFRLLLHTQGLSENPSEQTSDSCALQPDTEQFRTIDQSAAIVGTLPPLSPACNQQLQNQGKLPIPDYGIPAWMMPQDCESYCNESRRPPTWLTVLGRDGFWAIAAMNEKTTRERKPNDDDGHYDSEIPLSLELLLMSLLGFAGFHMWCCWRASFTAKPSFRTHFANPDEYFTAKPSLRSHFPNPDEWPRHTMLVFLGGWFVATLPLLVGWGCGLFDWSSSGLKHPWLMSGVVGSECLIALGASIANILRMRRLGSGAKGHVGSLIALAGGCSVAALIVFGASFAWPLQDSLTLANRFFTYYRNMHILSGVSPVVPLLTLALGMYGWFWHSLHGLALLGADRSKLPAESDLWVTNTTGDTMRVLRMFSQEEAAEDTERGAKPLAVEVLICACILLAGFLVIIWAVSRNLPIRSLGAEYYAGTFLVCLVVCFSLMLAEAWQLLRTWSRLRQLLMFLDRTPLRRTLAALRGFSWGTVWGMSGNVLDVRYKLFSRQLESMGHTLSALQAKAADDARCCIGARSCIAVLAKLREADHDNSGDRHELAQSCLDALKQLRKSAKGSLRVTLDAARDCIVAQKLDVVMADPAAMAGVQECISALEKFISCESKESAAAEKACIDALTETRAAGTTFWKWYSENYSNFDAEHPKLLKSFQMSAARTAGTLLVSLLLPDWRTETNSLILTEKTEGGENDDTRTAPPLSEKHYIRSAEEFVCLPYLGFVQNILGRMRSIVMSILCLFVATAIAISSYPFDPRQGLSGTILALFILLAGTIFYVYAQMHRDATLSHVTNTTPGELGGDFWLKIVSLGIAPLLGLLTTIFPGIADFVFSWLQPGLQSIK